MDLAAYIRNIPDFPKPGIQFKDITTLLGNGAALRHTIDALRDRYAGKNIDAIVGVEARGFIFGTALAYALGIAFVPVRKPGKLPFETLEMDYNLEYGSDVLEIHSDALAQGQRVVIVDDLLATGGTVEAVIKLMNAMDVHIEEVVAIIELLPLKGRDRLHGVPVHSLIQYDEA